MVTKLNPSITFVIPSYNNLRYLKNAYSSIRKYSNEEHEIIILDDASMDGTVEWLRSLKDDNLVIWENPTKTRLGHTITYNIGAKLAKNEIFGILHADMFIGPNYIENILKHIKPGVVVSATRIEPPLHPAGLEKIVKDFGMWPETFLEKEFIDFVNEEQIHRKNQTTRGIFAPWFMYKEDFIRIGGHDDLFAPFPYEDSDIFQRFILAGYEIIQSRDALVYHLTCRGHKWTDNNELGKVDNSFINAEENARKNYLRKWNSWIKNDEYHAPIIPSKYDVCLILENINVNVSVLGILEPWFGKTILHTNRYDTIEQTVVTPYVTAEQVKTKLDMKKRVVTETSVDLTNHDVYVIIDVSKITNDDFVAITQLSTLLQELENSEDYIGQYEIGNVRIKVNKLTNIVTDLIHC